MAESQSRYSIIANLAKQKIDVMGAKHGLKDELKKAEQEYANCKKGFDHARKEAQDQFDRMISDYEQEINVLKQRADNLRERLQDKETMYDDKIAAIEDALKRIEDVSTAHSQG